jgi:hypothetical protein
MNYEELYYENKKRKNIESTINNDNENNFLKQRLDDENKKFLTKTKIQQIPEVKLNSLNHARMLMKSKKNNDLPGVVETNPNVNSRNLEIRTAEQMTIKRTFNEEKEIYRILEEIFGFKIRIQSTEKNQIFEFHKKNEKKICHFQLIFDIEMNEESVIEYVPIEVNLDFDEEDDKIFLNERIHITPSDLPYIVSNFSSKI